MADLDVSTPTKNNILKLFQYFGFNTAFARADVMRVTKLTATPATDLMRKMKDAGLIVSTDGRGKYVFPEPEE